MDDLDQAILTQLQQSGRASITELARRIDLSPPATHARIRHLEAQGIIRQYTALLDRERVGYDMLCFVSVTLRSHTPEQVEEFRSAIQAMPEVLSLIHI